MKENASLLKENDELLRRVPSLVTRSKHGRDDSRGRSQSRGRSRSHFVLILVSRPMGTTMTGRMGPRSGLSRKRSTTVLIVNC